jgi:hypothetical protein
MYMIKGFETTLMLLISIVSFTILIFVFLILKQRSALKKLDGFQGTGHWFSGHTSEIRKIAKVSLLKKFPYYFKFSEGLFRYRIVVMIQVLFDTLYTILIKRLTGLIWLG